jgi:predicted permease
MVFITSFTVLFPLFAKIGIGFALRHIGILTERSLRELNNMVFRVLLPVLLFSNLYKTDFATIESYNLLWFAVVIILITFTGYMMIIPKLISDNAKRGVLVQGITRSNFIFFGMPLATSLYGGTSVGIASLMVGVVVPLLNMTSVVSLEYFRGHRPDYQKILRGIITNPIIIGGALGLACTVTHIRLPEVLERLVFEIAGIATPVALIVLGGSVTFASVRMYCPSGNRNHDISTRWIS